MCSSLYLLSSSSQASAGSRTPVNRSFAASRILSLSRANNSTDARLLILRIPLKISLKSAQLSLFALNTGKCRSFYPQPLFSTLCALPASFFVELVHVYRLPTHAHIQPTAGFPAQIFSQSSPLLQATADCTSPYCTLAVVLSSFAPAARPDCALP